MIAEIGVGRAKKIDKLEVLWPTSKKNTSVFKNVEVNQKIKLIENRQEYFKLNLPATKFSIAKGHTHQH